ncbi:MAG: hypothetical protein KBA31_13350 [Alphaproteobacteria bacterium]|nr:hypothetical protein [Alphaproteobacteria bacterium]
MKSYWNLTLSAFALAASVGAAHQADASVLTVHAAGAIINDLTSSTGGTYFGLNPTSFVGAHAEFVWTIDIGQLGPSTVTPNSASWVYNSALIAPVGLDPIVNSGTPIGISGRVTINGVTLHAGIDRQVLFLGHDEAGVDTFALRDNTSRYAPLPALRDWVDLDITSLNNFFLSSVNPADLAGISLPCSGRESDRAIARLRYNEQFPPNGQFSTQGFVDLCAPGSEFSVEISGVPEPQTLALIVSALFALLGAVWLKSVGTFYSDERSARLKC